MHVGDSSASRTTEEEEIDKRVATWIEMEDPDIIVDLRAHNYSVGKYDEFWKQCKTYLQEITPVHERRHGSTTYLAVALSVSDLFGQVKKKCVMNWTTLAK